MVYTMQIKSRQDESAMAFGRKVLAPACVTDEDRAILDEALTLFAYEGMCLWISDANSINMHGCLN